MPFVPMNRREAALKRKSQLLSYELYTDIEDNNKFLSAITNILAKVFEFNSVTYIIEKMLCEEVFVDYKENDYQDKFKVKYLIHKELKNKNNLSVIECLLNCYYTNHENYNDSWHKHPHEALRLFVDELNDLFVEFRIGWKLDFYNYYYEFNRLEDTYIEYELIQPTLDILENQIFSEARRKYFEGYKKWREGKDYGEAIRLFYETIESFLPNVCSLLIDGECNDCKKIGDFFKWFKSTYYKESNDDQFLDIFCKQTERFISGISNLEGRRHASYQPMQIPESEMILVKNMVSSLIVYFGKFIQEQGKTIPPESDEVDNEIPFS